jgi:rod shape-determining protein MreC
MLHRLANPFFGIILIAALGMWSPSQTIWQKSIGRSATIASGLLQRVTNRVVAFVRLTDLDKENKYLKIENEQLKAEVARFKETEQNNEILRKEISSERIFSGYEAVSAKVIGHTPINFLQTLILDRGSRDGIKVGQTVTAQGYLVGQVYAVTATTCQVNIISGGRLMLPVILQDSRGTGTIRGGLEGLMVSDIPLDTLIKEGELVITQDTGGVIVPGIPVGAVRRIIKKQGDIFQQAIADSSLQFTKLEMVIILRQKEE